MPHGSTLNASKATQGCAEGGQEGARAVPVAARTMRNSVLLARMMPSPTSYGCTRNRKMTDSKTTWARPRAHASMRTCNGSVKVYLQG